METTAPKLDMIMINTRALRAAVHCAADKKDPRQYMQGVYVKFVRSDFATVAGCDGHVLFVGLAEIDPSYEFPDIAPWLGQSLVIPVDVIKKLDKRAKSVGLSQIDADLFRLGDSVFKPIDGQYPDIGRVIPSQDDLGLRTITPALFNPVVLGRAQKALQSYYETKPDVAFDLAQYGTDSGIMHNNDSLAQVVVIPMRSQSVELTPPAFDRSYL